jgi:allantoicase
MTFTEYPDLASRTLGGSVVAANDEAFAERENLIKPEPAQFAESDFGHKGKVYDGWETRRRREPGSDWAIVRLGAAGVVRGVVIDTAWFKGNYPPEASVEAASVEGFPDAAELDDAEWTTVVDRAPVKGDSENLFEVNSPHRWTHLRLTIYPDGGVARFRAHGEAIPDPRLLPAAIDFAALENGGRVIGCSNRFYSSPTNLIQPDRARTMGEGWENARRRDDGNDYVEFGLAASARLRLVEIDTSYFLHNAPGAAAVHGRTDDGDVVELVPRTKLQPDTRHILRVTAPARVRQVRLDVYPDGGLARVRMVGDLDAAARDELALRWFNALPEGAAEQLLAAAGIDSDEAAPLVAARPLADAAALAAVLALD